jgi:hypothetical protein
VAYLDHIDNGAVRNRSCALDAKVALSVSVAAAPRAPNLHRSLASSWGGAKAIDLTMFLGKKASEPRR